MNKFKSKEGIDKLSNHVIDALISDIYICEEEIIIVYEYEYKNVVDFIK